MIRPCLDATVAAISSYRSDQLEEVNAMISSELKDFGITMTSSQKTDFRAQVQEKYIDALLAQLQDRLPDVAELEAFSILDPSKLPDQSCASFTTYGSSQLDMLSSRYGVGDRADIDKEELISEWIGLKQIIDQSYRHMSAKQFVRHLSTDSTMLTMFPNFSKIASITRILPVSTAECEHCFSLMKRIKSTSRNRMETDTLNKLMRICVEGPTLENFDFNKAADM